MNALRLTALIGVTVLLWLPPTPMAADINSHALAANGWYSDDTRADGTGSLALGTDLVSKTFLHFLGLDRSLSQTTMCWMQLSCIVAYPALAGVAEFRSGGHRVG